MKKLRIRPFSNKCRRSGKRQTESVTLRKKISYHHIAGVIHLSRKDTKSCVRQKRGSSFLQIFDTFCETGLRYPAELCLVELVVRALFCHQFVVGSPLDDPSLLHDHDAVRVLDRGKSVGYDK